MIVDIQPLVLGPIVKGPEGSATSTSIKIWGQGSCNQRCGQCTIIARLIRPNGEVCHEHARINVQAKHNYIGIVEFNDCLPDTEYIFEIGYFRINKKWLKDENISFAFNWSSASRGLVRTAADSNSFNSASDSWNFVFGSCRYHLSLGGKSILGTGQTADRIFRSINERNPSFFLSIGDQVYLDPLGSVGRLKDIKDIWAKYEKVFGYPHIKKLFENTPTYFMCDDHDLHCNNTNWKLRNEDPEGFKNGLQAYREYQHLRGPEDTNCLYYTFDWNNATFFVMDTRSERDERTEINNVRRYPTMIGTGQMEALRLWIRNPRYASYVKFLVSPTPFLSQMEEDSWYGFAKQQGSIIELLLGEDFEGRSIDNLFILTGDAHCARIATYQISDRFYDMGNLTEIMSSGLVAMAHDQGKSYDKKTFTNEEDYNKSNNFPLAIDNTSCGGLLARTIYASPTFPEPAKPSGPIQQIKRLYTNPVDNVFTNIVVNPSSIIIEIYNQDNKLLFERLFDLTPVEISDSE